jgi:hypothetical protein
MGQKHSATERVGGPRASHENAQHPDKSKRHNSNKTTDERSDVSGGGGENDAHHTHNPSMKGKGREQRK